MGADVVDLDLSRPFTAARARAEGFARLEQLMPNAQWVMFVDGDCEVQPGWLAIARTFLTDNPTFAAVCGRRRERHPERSRYNALIDREWDTPVGEASACGGDALYRISAYRQVGGFDPQVIAGEEPELCSRMRSKGWRVMRLDVEMTVHDADILRFGQWWNRAVRSGLGFAQAWRLTRHAGRDALYRRNLLRALAWAAALPCLSLALAFAVNGWLVLLWPVVVGLQIIRMTRREGWFAAVLAMIGKFAELYGILLLASRILKGQTGGAVSYK
jgi:cellulose synthase/poly-beta-1,6-N-acetylglucosamine synthase-like glycosyltransferase